MLWEATKCSKKLQSLHVTLGEAFYLVYNLKLKFRISSKFKIPRIEYQSSPQRFDSTKESSSNIDDEDNAEGRIMGNRTTKFVEKDFAELHHAVKTFISLMHSHFTLRFPSDADRETLLSANAFYFEISF